MSIILFLIIINFMKKECGIVHSENFGKISDPNPEDCDQIRGLARGFGPVRGMRMLNLTEFLLCPMLYFWNFRSFAFFPQFWMGQFFWNSETGKISDEIWKISDEIGNISDEIGKILESNSLFLLPPCIFYTSTRRRVGLQLRNSLECWVQSNNEALQEPVVVCVFVIVLSLFLII